MFAVGDDNRPSQVPKEPVRKLSASKPSLFIFSLRVSVFLQRCNRSMGRPLRMDTLHAPTVPSGPTSNFSERNGATGKQSFAELQRKKDDLEAELKALGSVLDSV